MSERTPLYVRIPRAHAERLDQAAFELKMSKQDLVTGLIQQSLGKQAPGFTRRETTLEIDDALTVGRASFRPNEEREVMSLADVADFLDVEEATIAELAGAERIPGRKLGDEWRFSRRAILDWLAHA